jgi:hypothetical protein
MRDDILDVAQGDARLAARIREMLGALADGENEMLREMARGVLDGAPLRDSALSDAYGEELGSAFGTFWTKYCDMSPSECADLEELGRADLDAP